MNYKIIKRILDFIISLVLMIISLPFVLIFSLILFLELRRFPLFVQERGLTLTNQRLKIIKLRTLRDDKPGRRARATSGIFYKPHFSGQIPPFARWLRKTGLDELPQLLNVLSGSMSLIGPRPLMIQDLRLMKRKYPSYYAARDKIRSKPGLSGLWQVFGFRDLGVVNMMNLDSVYENLQSLVLDLKIIAATIPVVLLAKNSDAILNNRRNNYLKYLPYFIKISKSQVNGKDTFSVSLPKDVIFSRNDETKKYTVELPEDWWYVINSYQILKDRNRASIFRIGSKDKEYSNKTA